MEYNPLFDSNKSLLNIKKTYFDITYIQMLIYDYGVNVISKTILLYYLINYNITNLNDIKTLLENGANPNIKINIYICNEITHRIKSESTIFIKRKNNYYISNF